jgi:hypothetical protein
MDTFPCSWLHPLNGRSLQETRGGSGPRVDSRFVGTARRRWEKPAGQSTDRDKRTLKVRCGPAPLAKYSCAVLPFAVASGRDLSHRRLDAGVGGRILGDWIEALAHGISDRLTSPHVRW